MNLARGGREQNVRKNNLFEFECRISSLCKLSKASSSWSRVRACTRSRRKSRNYVLSQLVNVLSNFALLTLSRSKFWNSERRWHTISTKWSLFRVERNLRVSRVDNWTEHFYYFLSLILSKSRSRLFLERNRSPARVFKSEFISLLSLVISHSTGGFPEPLESTSLNFQEKRDFPDIRLTKLLRSVYDICKWPEMRKAVQLEF